MGWIDSKCWDSPEWLATPDHWSYSEGKRKCLGLSKNKSVASAKPDAQRAGGGMQRELMQTFSKHSEKENSRDSADRQTQGMLQDGPGTRNSLLFSLEIARLGACWGFFHIRPEALGRISQAQCQAAALPAAKRLQKWCSGASQEGLKGLLSPSETLTERRNAGKAFSTPTQHRFSNPPCSQPWLHSHPRERSCSGSSRWWEDPSELRSLCWRHFPRKTWALPFHSWVLGMPYGQGTRPRSCKEPIAEQQHLHAGSIPPFCPQSHHLLLAERKAPIHTELKCFQNWAYWHSQSTKHSNQWMILSYRC